MSEQSTESSGAAPDYGFWQAVRAAVRGTSVDFTEAPLRTAIVILAVPMVLENGRVTAYRAKVKAIHEDCVEVRCEFITDPRKGTKEVTAQFIPMNQVKRISVSQSDRYLHI